ncbi:hypothetical protein Tco_0687419 [Tanacetum coccineum]
MYRGNPRLAKLVILGAFSGSGLVTYYEECNKEDFFLRMKKIKDGNCQALNLELEFKLLCDAAVRCVCYISAANVHLMLLRNYISMYCYLYVSAAKANKDKINAATKKFTAARFKAYVR